MRGRIDAPRVGIFERGTHWVVDMPECRIHHPAINEVAGALRRAITDTRTAPYNEKTGRGLVRYVQVAVARDRGASQIVIVGNCGRADTVDGLLQALIERLGARLQGLFFSAQTDRGNAILGATCERAHGAPMLEESIAGAQVFYPPDAFGQSNLDAYEQAVRRVGDHVPDGSDVVELYAGVGAIGLSLLRRVGRVRFNEVAEGSLAGLRAGVARLPEEDGARVEVHAGTAGDHAALARNAECLIVDPPRKGLEPSLLAALCEAPPRRLVYLSCDVGTLRRDVKALHEAGMGVRAVDAFDFFPYTAHVESLVLLGR